MKPKRAVEIAKSIVETYGNEIDAVMLTIISDGELISVPLAQSEELLIRLLDTQKGTEELMKNPTRTMELPTKTTTH